MTVLQAEQKRNKNYFIKLWLCHILISFSLLVCLFSKADPLTDPKAKTEHFDTDVKAQPQKENLQEDLKTEALIDFAQDSVWQIFKPFRSGTAFFIRPNVFVTNFHVLQGMLQNEDSFKTIFLQQEGNPSSITINQVIAVSALHELALVETKESVSSYLNIKEETPHNEKLFVLGYPHQQFKKMKKTGQLIDKDFFYIFPINHSRLKGASGSPVLNEKMQVVGISYQASGNLLRVKKSIHLNSLILGNIGQKCPHFVNLAMCIKQEIEDLKRLAEQDFAPAQYRLAKIYYLGKGTKLNLTSAFNWMKQPAEQGYVHAQFDLAKMYYFGKGTKKDEGFSHSLV